MAGQLPLTQPVSYYDRPVHPHWKVVVHTVSGAREVRTWKQVPCRNGMSCRWARRGCRFQHEERDFEWEEIAQFHDLGLAQQCALDVDEPNDQATRRMIKPDDQTEWDECEMVD